MRQMIFALCVMCVPWSQPLSDTFLVRPDGSGPYPTIQDALDGSADGDTVLLASGRFTGDGNRNIVVPDRRIILRSAHRDPRRCIIDCEGAGRGFMFGNYGCGGSLYPAPLATGSSTNAVADRYTAVVEAITITNGAADRGGAVLCGKRAAPCFMNCIFTRNHASVEGGALVLSGDRATLRNCVVSENTASIKGGGISFCFQSFPIHNPKTKVSGTLGF